MLRDNERDTRVDVYETDQVRCLCFVSICKMVDIIDGEDRRAGSRTENRHALVEAHVGLRYSSEEGFDELVDVLPSLACQISETGLESRVHW